MIIKLYSHSITQHLDWKSSWESDRDYFSLGIIEGQKVSILERSMIRLFVFRKKWMTFLDDYKCPKSSNFDRAHEKTPPMYQPLICFQYIDVVVLLGNFKVCYKGQNKKIYQLEVPQHISSSKYFVIFLLCPQW